MPLQQEESIDSNFNSADSSFRSVNSEAEEKIIKVIPKKEKLRFKLGSIPNLMKSNSSEKESS